MSITVRNSARTRSSRRSDRSGSAVDASVRSQGAGSSTTILTSRFRLRRRVEHDNSDLALAPTAYIVPVPAARVGHDHGLPVPSSGTLAHASERQLTIEAAGA